MTRKRSLKPIKSFDECIRKFHCTFPLEAANDTDKNGNKVIGVGVNHDCIEIQCGVEVTLEHKFWSLLRGINFPHLPRYSYDPIRGENGWYPF